MTKKSLALSKVYQLIEPGPVVMLTTVDGKKANVMTMSWHMMIDFEPPLLALVVSNQNHTFETLKKTKECVVNIPTVEIAKKVVACGNVSGSDVDKFKKFGLATSAASMVHAPLLDDCYASLECKVVDAKLATKYNVFIVEVVKAWIDRSNKNPRTLHHCGAGNFVVDGKMIKVPSRMK